MRRMPRLVARLVGETALDTFSYTVSDGNGGTDTATVTVNDTPVNDAAVAEDDTATTDEDTPVVIDVLGNDSDVEGDPLTAALVSGTAHGALTLNANGSFSNLALPCRFSFSSFIPTLSTTAPTPPDLPSGNFTSTVFSFLKSAASTFTILVVW